MPRKKTTKATAKKSTKATAKKSTKKSSSGKRSEARDELLGPEDVRAILDACGDGPTADRNRAMIATLAGSGIRIAEALALEERDVDLKKRRLHVRQGKNSKDRYAWLSKDAVKPLRAWMKERGKLKLEGEAPVFCSLAGKPLYDSYVRRVLPKLGKEAGLTKRVHAHALRHAFACEAHRNNVSLRALQLQLGHSSISATSSYLERLGLEAAFADFQSAFE